MKTIYLRDENYNWKQFVYENISDLSEAETAKIGECVSVLISLVKERDDYKKVYEKNVDLALKKSIEYEKMRVREQALRIMLAQACQEIESQFDEEEKLASVDIAIEYTVWAKFLETNYGRDDYGRVKLVQEWLNKQTK